mmetsp:Transcript_8716/g.13469  ORF Transcript_8716/g.13469 Transcript_8716/m.13469 type:complete len:256 (-) Transcript_8716:176-943(-)
MGNFLFPGGITEFNFKENTPIPCTRSAIDIVHLLSTQERRERLLSGYITCVACNVPTDVKAICMQYLASLLIESKTEKKAADMPPDRVAIIGIGAVGKSSTTLRSVDDCWVDEYDPSIEDWYQKIFEVDGKIANLEILDTAEQDTFGCISMLDIWIRESDCFILMYSIDNRRSFEEVIPLYNKIKGHCEDTDNNCVLVGNKMDLSDEYRQISHEEGQQLANKWECPFIEISAKKNVNVAELFEITVRLLRKPHME